MKTQNIQCAKSKEDMRDLFSMLLADAIARGGAVGGAEVDDNGYPTLAEMAGRIDGAGNALEIANTLSQKNGVLEDMPWMEGNTTTGHLIAQTTTSLPSATWRTMNRGVTATKGQSIQYTEQCGRLEDLSRVDEAMAELNGGAVWRNSEDMLKVEGFAQQFASAMWYDSLLTNPERIHGLSARYAASTGYTNSGYVKVGTNSGSNCHSIWLVTWAPRKIYGIFPKGTKAGLERNDKGLLQVHSGALSGDASAMATFFAWTTQFVWRCGIAVEDYRYAVRFQWDPDDETMGINEKGLYLGVAEMLDIIFECTAQTKFYMNRTSLRRLNSQFLANENRPITYVDSSGRLVGDQQAQGAKRMPEVFGIKVRLTDSLVAESAIS